MLVEEKNGMGGSWLASGSMTAYPATPTPFGWVAGAWVQCHRGNFKKICRFWWMGTFQFFNLYSPEYSTEFEESAFQGIVP